MHCIRSSSSALAYTGEITIAAKIAHIARAITFTPHSFSISPPYALFSSKSTTDVNSDWSTSNRTEIFKSSLPVIMAP